MTDVQQHNREILANVRVHRDDLYESILGLERALTVPARGRVEEWAGNVGEQVRAVRAALDRHLAVTEGDHGLFDDVMQQAPHLAHAIERLEREHVALASSIDEEARRVEAVGDAENVEEVRAELLDVIRALMQHRHRGAELVYEAYDVDLAAGD